MKLHAKKKAFRLACKRQALAGYINTATGTWAPRGTVGNSVGRDYYPQSSKR